MGRWVGVGQLNPPNNTSRQGIGTNVDHFCPKVVDHCLHPEAPAGTTTEAPPPHPRGWGVRGPKQVGVLQIGLQSVPVMLFVSPLRTIFLMWVGGWVDLLGLARAPNPPPPLGLGVCTDSDSDSDKWHVKSSGGCSKTHRVTVSDDIE